MIKKIFYRLFIVSIFLCMTISIFSFNKVTAANYSFNFVGQTEANRGDTITFTITANGLTGKVSLSANNASLSDSQKWVEKNSVSITATINDFPATITATPEELTDNDYNIVDISPVTVIVNEIQRQQVIEEPQQQETAPPSTISYSQESSSQAQASSKPSQSTTSVTIGKQTATQEITANNPTTENQGAVSSNNYLKSLSINNQNINFDRETTKYVIDNVTENEITVFAEAEDERAIVSGLGSIALIEGENIINISVTAENLAVRNYEIIVNKAVTIKESNLRLKSLKVKKIDNKGNFYSVNIGFEKDKFNYYFDVENDISDLDVEPTVTEEGIITEVKGEQNLKEGENDIDIILTDINDKTVKTKYNLKVKKAKSPVVEIRNNTQEKKNYLPVILFNVLIFIIIELLIFKYVKERQDV